MLRKILADFRSLLLALLTIVGIGAVVFFLYFYLPAFIAYFQRGAE